MYNVVLSLIFCPRKIGENAFLCCFQKSVGATGQRIGEIGSNFFYEIKPYVKYCIVSQGFRRRVLPENEKLEKNRKRRGLKKFPIFVCAPFFPFVLFKRYRCYNIFRQTALSSFVLTVLADAFVFCKRRSCFLVKI